jgi:hypothetical protein
MDFVFEINGESSWKIAGFFLVAKQLPQLASINGTVLVFIYVTMPMANEQVLRRSRLMMSLHIIITFVEFYQISVWEERYIDTKRTLYFTLKWIIRGMLEN